MSTAGSCWPVNRRARFPNSSYSARLRKQIRMRARGWTHRNLIGSWKNVRPAVFLSRRVSNEPLASPGEYRWKRTTAQFSAIITGSVLGHPGQKTTQDAWMARRLTVEMRHQLYFFGGVLGLPRVKSLVRAGPCLYRA
jgi:hypothetical protein